MPALNLMSNAWALQIQSLDDLEKTRIAMANRLELMTRPLDKEDADGQCRGLGLSSIHPAVDAAKRSLDAMKSAEAEQIKALEKQFKKHPIYPFVKNTAGFGSKTTLRLMGAIGDPYWNSGNIYDQDGEFVGKHDRPRTLDELKAYCGLTPFSRKRKGMQANWNAEARKRLHVIATGMVKNVNSAYRGLYDDWKSYYLNRGEMDGKDMTAGHAHNMAIRKVMIAIVTDLYDYASGLHEAHDAGWLKAA